LPETDAILGQPASRLIRVLLFLGILGLVMAGVIFLA